MSDRDYETCIVSSSTIINSSSNGVAPIATADEKRDVKDSQAIKLTEDRRRNLFSRFTAQWGV